jgi:homoserine kinase
VLSRGAALPRKARRLGQALERIADDPDRVAPAAAGLGSRTAAAVAAMMAQIIATTIVRTLVKQRER